MLDRFFRFRPPALFALYVALYTGFRFFLEQLRVDPSERVLRSADRTRWSPPSSSSSPLAFFIWWQFLRGDDPHVRQRERKVEPPPTMAVPRGRVRPRG